MHIPQRLPQFEGERILLLVTGLRAGKVFVARDGEIKKVDEFEEPIPKYSDKEGFFESSGHGRVIRSGSTREINDKDLAQRFIKKTLAELRRVLKDQPASAVYLFSSRSRELKKYFSDALRSRIRQTFVGDYLHARPLELIAMIEERRQARRVNPIKLEAKKILSKRKTRPK